MKVIVSVTGEEVEAIIEPASEKDLKAVKRNREFGFDWSIYTDCAVLKFRLVDDQHILGLVAIKEYPGKGYEFIEIITLELNKRNIGRNKEYERIAGCVIAHVCKLSFERGYEGFVSLTPKTILRRHYQEKYGFDPINKTVLLSNTSNSRRLIDSYLK